METLATGRIALWEGASLWVFDVPGKAEGPSRRDMHAHHAFQLTFSLGGEFSLHLEDRVLSGPFGLVRPDVPHAFEARGLIAHLFIEPESGAGRSLMKLVQGEADPTRALAQAREVPDQIRAAFLDPADPLDAMREVGSGIVSQITGYSRSAQPDRRVRQIIAWANANLDRTLSISEVAPQVGLSPSRASHLFVEETGIALRHYVLWLRLIRAVETYARDRSLTEAAHEAGFADSAHLSRTFKRMFGLPAASLKLS